ncbi:nucleotidyltransferase domain-containing protein [Metabacillus bambusae]|uniref:Nucleotidyltransferase family protein n=1 Tax=Metabacillus bambusae TaxID=2795218 RepID=A0ABS3N2R2_9BACI|nr:nucleotidyltransferase family protein [Metabacillus bambusae]MBO1512379.1 nucleotidyltransferase family protein [Metabacillus bambusae]
MVKQFELELANVPREVKLILQLLKKDNHKLIEENSTEIFADIDWNLFIEQAKHHRVFPVLQSKLKGISNNLIPSFVFQKLLQDYKINTFNMLQLSAEMERVSRIFIEEKIRLLFLKGPVIAHDLYGDISLRTSSDLDFLIPLEDLNKAEVLLQKLGYEKEDYIKTVLNDWKWRHHHVTYFHPQKRMKLEIHWRLNPGPGFEPNFEELWMRKSKSKLTSYPVFFLGKEDLFLFLVSHGARHGWSRLRWLLDIHQMTEQDIDWVKTNKLLKKYHIHNIGAQALVLSSNLLNSKNSGDMKTILENRDSWGLAQEAIFYLERMVNLHTDPVPEDISRYHTRHLISLMSRRQRVLFYLSFLHPYSEDAETLPLPKQLHFLYFPLRPVLWAWRRTRKHALP